MKRNHKTVTPVMDWQIQASLVGTKTPEYVEQAVKLVDAVVEVSKKAGLYHVDGEEGTDEHLHIQFVMVDPKVFYEMAKSLGMKGIDGMEFDNLEDLLNMLNKEGDDNDKKQ